MGGSELNLELFHRILSASFENPLRIPQLVDQEISRSRSLHSSQRRELSDLVFDALRWRRRVWGEIAPSAFKDHSFFDRLREAKDLRANPPLAKWSALTMDALARELSFPTWMIEDWVRDIGFQSTVSLALALNEPAPTIVRVNTLKISRDEMIKLFQKDGIEATPGRHSPDALRLQGRINMRGYVPFKQGWFEIQDESSQLAASKVGARSGQTVVDACTGAGGKALAMAAAMRNEGTLVATDADNRKLEELGRRAKRAGATVIHPEWVAQDDPSPVPKLRGKADAVLVDAPCSGLGVLRRSPWMKWSLGHAAAEAFPKKQLNLLGRYALLPKPGGRLVYATCTLRSEENEGVAKNFLQAHPDFAEESPPIKLHPGTDGTDGFFIASFLRNP